MGAIQQRINQFLGTFAISAKLGSEGGQLRAQEKGQRQLKSRRKFADYLSKLETSFGGTVGDLPKSVQKTIAKQYSYKERKEIMDRMDKEGKK